MGFASLGSRFRGGEEADQRTTFVIYSTELLLYGFCVPWEQVTGRLCSRLNDDICDLFGQNTYSMGFASIGSRFRGGEVADQMMTFVIYSTECLLYGFRVPWYQVPGR